MSQRLETVSGGDVEEDEEEWEYDVDEESSSSDSESGVLETVTSRARRSSFFA